jgi:hypothetical protein
MMIVTRKHLQRRTFLKGIGAAIGLPLLDSMVPAFAAKSETAAPVRLAFTYLPNGIIMKDWTPGTAGKDFELPGSLKPLAPFREQMLVLTGLKDNTGNALGDAGGDHARASASYLTGVHPKKTAGADVQAGASVDQIAAKVVGSKTRLPSLELTLDYTRAVGNCDSGYSCAYMNGLSWRSPTSSLPPDSNPRLVFERLFGNEDVSLDPETRSRRATYRKSILDLVSADAERITASVGPADRRKIDEYLYAIRDIERRIESAEKASSTSESKRVPAFTLEKPTGIPGTYSEHAKLMFDLQVMAFQADLTRVITFMFDREQGDQTYPEIGVSDPHHPLSHHRGNPEWIAKLSQIDLFHTQLFAYYIGKLKEIKEGDSTLLDHCMIVYGGGLSDGNRHSHEDLPTVLMGRGDGRLKSSRHITYPENTPLTNLYLSLLDRMGVETESLGDSTGKLEHLTDL